MVSYQSTNLKGGPARWADHLLEWFVAAHLLEYVQGDLQEVFYKRLQQVSLAQARREYGWAVIQCLTPSFYQSMQPTTMGHVRQFNDYSTPNFATMLRNYLKIAFRNLVKNKGYSVINIGGLAVGMAVAMLIGLCFIISERALKAPFLKEYAPLVCDVHVTWAWLKRIYNRSLWRRRSICGALSIGSMKCHSPRRVRQPLCD